MYLTLAKHLKSETYVYIFKMIVFGTRKPIFKIHYFDFLYDKNYYCRQITLQTMQTLQITLQTLQTLQITLQTT